MSLYTCLDLLAARDKEITAAILSNDTIDRTLITETNFISGLQLLIRNMIGDYPNNLQDWPDYVKHFHSHIECYYPNDPNSPSFKPLPAYLKKIKDHFSSIHQKLDKNLKPGLESNLAIWQKYKKNMIANLRQGCDPMHGASKGYCRGYVYFMIGSNSPYLKRPSQPLHLTREVHDFQENTDPIATIKRTRLTRRHFCPDLSQQAQELYRIADLNRGKELYVSLREKKLAHAIYLSVQEDGKIRFTEPNFSAYLFDTPEEFFDFYVGIYELTEVTNRYKFYTVSQLTHDPTNIYKETCSFSGKLRTLLTGPKYSRTNFILEFTSFVLITAISATFAFVLGGAIGYIFGNIILQYALAVIFDIALLLLSDSLTDKARNAGYYGLLAIPHVLMENWYNWQHGSPNPTGKQPLLDQRVLQQEGAAKIDDAELPSHLPRNGGFSFFKTPSPNTNEMRSANGNEIECRRLA